MKAFNLFELETAIEIADVGAAAISETPIYSRLLNLGFGHLHAFDGDPRQKDKIAAKFGASRTDVHSNFLYDGSAQEAHICQPESGMTSLLKPREKALNFFNGFEKFGDVIRTESVQTTKMDEVDGLPDIDFLKMDAQGSELEILRNATKRTKNTVAMQLEVSFFALYEGQPDFGTIDSFMRSNGFIPHRFLEVKRWSIAPTVFNNNIRIPGNQLLEADIIYIKDPLGINKLSDASLQKLALLSHYAFQSPDLCVFVLLEMERRSIINKDDHQAYMKNIKSFI